MKSLVIALLTGSLALVSAADGKCRALAFSSGDENSAYQAGVIKGLVTSTALKPDDYAYDAVSGVSGGALNAVLMTSFPKGKEQDAATRMENFWVDAANSPLYKNWLGGVAEGLLFKGGLYNSQPMVDFLKKEFTSTTVQRNLNIGITDIKDGAYRSFTEANIAQGSNLIDSLYASMSFAGFFEPANVLGSTYLDGSSVWDVDIFSAINRCVEKGFSQDNIIVDVILTSAANLKEVEAANYKSVNMLFRYFEVSSFYNAMDGLLRAKFAYNGVHFRYVIAPSGDIPSAFNPLVSLFNVYNRIFGAEHEREASQSHLRSWSQGCSGRYC